MEEELEQKQVKLSLPKFVGRFVIQEDQMLGKGAYSKVYKAYDCENTESQLCCKIINLESVQKNQKALKNITREVETLQLLQNHYLPNIVQLIECFASKKNLYIFMELCNEGSLGKQIFQKRVFTEVEVITLIKQVAKTFITLQSFHIIHRDLKPDNILIHNQNIYKIGDFGFARIVENIEDSNLVTCLGSPLYMSPQLLLNSQTQNGKCDVWSLGCIAYEMLYGKCPFETQDLQTLVDCLKNQDIVFPQSKPIRSKKITNLVQLMLEKDESKRLSWNEIVQHEIFKYDTSYLSMNELLINQYLSNYNLSCSSKLNSSIIDKMYKNSRITLSKIVNELSENESQKKKKKN